MESSFYEHTARKRGLAAVMERSSVGEQLAYNQRVDGSSPSVPIRCTPHLHDKTPITSQEGIWQQSGVFLHVIYTYTRGSEIMGGRGGSSGMGKGSGNIGLDVTKDGQTTRYYFSNRNGTNYYQRGISGTPQPTPANMSAKEFKHRVESNGATTRAVSGTERRKDQKAYKADRKATNEFLNIAEFNRTAAKGSRSDNIDNRANRRSRR